MTNPYVFTDEDKAPEGITLRDYFAGQALAGFCADSTVTENMNRTVIAEWCGLMADDMLKARKNG